ncbi:putative hydrolase or acyltransferase of alpha/b eta superfamily [Mycolicibacterium canariasense]|uniref:Putative hydrolase or acyltransferase of alpha/b eta superfamily n=1 Tax=Mycolicibacterium canariasense TaxID=228230 RepID=A0A117IC44_MYCCR|nr:hypothetical protein [Mycolicibacterium canariasense]MCV7213156.1 hypothetical protein [Mycolicibacterium canariasense]ORU98490.1 hypothetical protein AWB94_28525 [Mycolicibacterium canariasense]GAS98882.1 putative hydrolase or acyltransferase of alpha/b eta superfamily [Mycolicibacterium canariasense]
MTKIREYAKAIAALLGAVATFLVSVNAPAEWSVYLGSVVAILTGVATFGVPNRPAPTGPPAPVDERVISDVQAAVQERDDRAASAAEADTALENILKGVNQAIGGTPIIGAPTAAALDLVEQFLKSTRR